MSQKRYLKRIALVVASALAIGGFSAISAQAIGTNLTVSVGYAGATTQTGTMVAGPANASSVTAGAANEYVTVTGGTFTGGLTSTTLLSGASIGVNTPTVGTVTVSGYIQTGPGVFSPTVTDTVTINVLSAPAGTVYNHSTAFIGAVGSNVVADSAQSGSAVASSTPIAQVTVSQYSSADGSQPLYDANSTAIVATITGHGLIGVSPAMRGAISVVSAGTANSSVPLGTQGVQNFYVYPDGTAGTGTISISVNGAVVATKTVTFNGTFATYTTASTQSTPLGIGNVDAIVYTGLDSNKNPAVITGTVVATSSNPAVASVSVSGNTVNVTGLTSGTTTISVTNSLVATAVATLNYTVSKNTAKTVTFSFDKASYAPGEKMTLTVKAVDSNGSPVANNTYTTTALNTGNGLLAYGANSSPVTANVALQGNLPTNSITLVNGMATYVLYAPLTGGTVLVTAKEGPGTDNVIANGINSAAVVTASVNVVVDTTVSDASKAAADAAKSAADAAKAASDAAKSASDSAMAATTAAQDASAQAVKALAAVNALSVYVATMMKSITAQLKALSALILKVQATLKTKK